MIDGRTIRKLLTIPALSLLAACTTTDAPPATDLPTHASIVIACGGYAPSINDHVEWDMTISGAQGDWGDGQPFKVREIKNFYILTRPGTEIRINKGAETYVMWGPRGRNAPPVEYSRPVLGEGCEIPKWPADGKG